MVRYYCDVCGKELREHDHKRIKFKDGVLMVEVMTGKHTTMNDGHFCHACIRDAIVEFVTEEAIDRSVPPFVNYPVIREEE